MGELDEVKGISSLLYLLMVRMNLKLIEQRQEPLSLIDNFNYIREKAVDDAVELQ
jgi:hypothetical protein